MRYYLLILFFQFCGPVKSWKRAQDPSNGAPKGFGFCEFESAEGVLRALRLLSKFSIDGQELVVCLLLFIVTILVYRFFVLPLYIHGLLEVSKKMNTIHFMHQSVNGSIGHICLGLRILCIVAMPAGKKGYFYCLIF